MRQERARAAAPDPGAQTLGSDGNSPIGPPRHIHHREDETFQILEGSYRVWIDGRTHGLEPGAMTMVPKGTPHAFRCLGPSHGRTLTTVVPGGLDGLFLEVEARGFKLPNDMNELIALGARHAHEFIGPPLAD